MFRFEGYTLDVARNALRAADREVQLRPKTFEVLRYLLENAGRLVTKEELLKAIWPNVAVTDESLTHCVSEIRQAIGDSTQAIIATVPRRGYRFAVAVSHRSGSATGLRSSLPPCGGGSGWGVEGFKHRCTPRLDPHPRPLSTRGRGAGQGGLVT